MIPIIIKEESASLFSYWRNGVREGMSDGKQLYALLESCSLQERVQAYQKACHLSQRGFKTCITRSEKRYAIWVDLKSLAFLENTSGRSQSPSLQVA